MCLGRFFYMLKDKHGFIIYFQVYSLQQGRRDVETVFTMGIMEDVNLVPQPAGGKFFFETFNAL